MKQNKETISGLEEGVQGAVELGHQQNAPMAPEPEGERSRGGGGGEELYRLREFSKELKKRYDDLKQSAVRKTRELENRLDSIRDLEVDAVDPRRWTATRRA